MTAQVSESVGVYMKAGEWYWLLGYLAGTTRGLTNPTLEKLLDSITESMK